MATEKDQDEAEAAPQIKKAPHAEAPVQKAKEKPVVSEESKLPKTSENKVKFLPWFTGALHRFNGVKAHHMTAVRAYFRDLGLGEPETSDAYDQGLIKFGYGRKN